MPHVRVSALADAINAARLVTGDDATISSITNDSRAVTPGSLYAALPGEHVDGHTFIGDAVRAGATAVLCSEPPGNLPRGVAVLMSEWPRLALSEISNVFFGAPSEQLRVIGVTGTDGKTSTVHFIHQFLQAVGESSAFLSTAAMDIDSGERANLLHQSTPEAPVLHATLARMVAAGKRFAVVESTSHGLSAQSCRLAHVRYTGGLLTSLSHEHLEYHRTFENYRHDKANLFRSLDAGSYSAAGEFAGPGIPDVPPGEQRRGLTAEAIPPERLSPLADAGLRQEIAAGASFGVINLGCPDAPFFAGATRRPVFGYSLEARPAETAQAALFATDIRPHATGSEFRLVWGSRSAPARIPMPGFFNVENALGAILCVALATGCEPADLAPAVERLRPVRGRMNVIQSEPFAVVVDYAHTPGSFRQMLPVFRSRTTGRLILVFGAAGERDREKRPLLGRVADAYADIIILADEDPRMEDGRAILEEVAAGCPARVRDETLFVIRDRREAIRTAFRVAEAGDTVLLLGKGHETSIIGPSGPDPWDEESVAREELAHL